MLLSCIDPLLGLPCGPLQELLTCVLTKGSFFPSSLLFRLYPSIYLKNVRETLRNFGSISD